MNNDRKSKVKEENQQKSTAIAETVKFELATMDVENVGEALLENLGGEGISPFHFDRLSFPTAGVTHWTIYDSLLGEETPLKEIIGVVFHQSTNRSYWSAEFSGTGVQPDCSSDNGIVGQGSPGGVCNSCPNNRFGSRGRGKACKESRELYLLREKSSLPLVLSIPPSSIKYFHDFCIHLGMRGIKLHQAVSRFSLTFDKNADGIKFSKLKTKFLYKLPHEESENLKKFRDSFLKAFAPKKSSTEANDVPQDERVYEDEIPF